MKAREGAAFLVVLGILFSTGAASAGTVSGKVRILEKGNVPRQVVREVLVFIEGVREEAPASHAARKIASQNKEFVPHVEVVPVGGTIHFPNLDAIMHNVFSITKGNRFDLGLYKDGAGKEVVFESSGLVRIYCNIHPQMSAYVHVMESPYYAWAQPDGNFRIDGVPPGSYTLKAWHEEGEAAKPIVVADAGASGLTIDVDVSAFVKRPHLNKFGKPYKREKY